VYHPVRQEQTGKRQLREQRAAELTNPRNGVVGSIEQRPGRMVGNTEVILGPDFSGQMDVGLPYRELIRSFTLNYRNSGLVGGLRHRNACGDCIEIGNCVRRKF
jgi:hypothetical protein